MQTILLLCLSVQNNQKPIKKLNKQKINGSKYLIKLSKHCQTITIYINTRNSLETRIIKVEIKNYLI